MNTRILEAKSGVHRFEMNELAEKVGWGKSYYKDEGKWEYMLARTAHVAYIKKDGQLIAFGRIVEDGKMCMFYDICVHPDHQGHDLGTLLMEHLTQKIKDKSYTSIGLFAWEANKTLPSFYSKFGFEKSMGMELKKYQSKN